MTPASRLPSRSQPPWAIVAALLLVFALSAHGADTAKSGVPEGDTRAQLSVGYSLLYQEASGISKLKWLLKFKDKTSDMGQLTHEVLSYYQQLADTMEKLSKQYPAMRIDAQAMSPIESEERKSIGADQAKDMAPLIGKGGIPFERETLLMFYDALNEQRHLTRVMAAQETSPALKKFLEATTAQLDERHGKVGKLLKRRYFVH